MYEASLSCSPTTRSYISNRKETCLPTDKTGIVDSGSTHMYIAPNAPYGQMNTTAKQIIVGTENGQVASSTATATLPITQLEADFPTKGYIVPNFTNTLIGVVPICDANFTVVFSKEDVTVLSPQGKPIIQGQREKKIPHLWRFALIPDNRKEKIYTTTSQKGPEANIVYDLPSVEALVRYIHAASGFPVRSTWLRAIKNGNFNSWPGLTYNNAAKYCPQSVETIKGHMVQSSQGVRSTNKTKHIKHSNQIEKSQEIFQ